MTASEQQNLFERDETRSLLDRMLTESRLYRTSKDYKELLDFVVRLRNFAPFNAMLLRVQKPGLTYAASAVRLAREVRSQTKRRRTAAADSLALWACGACLRCDGHRGQRPAAVLMPSPFTH